MEKKQFDCTSIEERELKSKLNIEADFSSKSAKEKIEKVGGSISVKNKKD